MAECFKNSSRTLDFTHECEGCFDILTTGNPQAGPCLVLEISA